MAFFQIPPQTRYDLKFNIMRIPVRVHPLFWLMGLLLGGSSGDLTQLLIWIFVIFISILIHELGHSLTMRVFNQDSYIVLHLGGGLAVPTSSLRGSPRTAGISEVTQQILILLAGPGAGFLLAALVLIVVSSMGGIVTTRWLLGIIPLPFAFLPTASSLVNSLIGTILWVNVFWGLINLVPLFPLDGGQIARHLFVSVDPWQGVRKSLWLSVISGALVAVAGLIFLNSVFMALFFGFLALQSYQMLRGV